MLGGGTCGGFDYGGEEAVEERATEEKKDNDDENDENDDDGNSAVVAAVEFSRGYLGFAWFDTRKLEVRCGGVGLFSEAGRET